MKKSSEQTLAATPVPALQDATDWATGVTTERPKIVKAWPRARAMIAWAWVCCWRLQLKAGQRLTVLLKFSRQARGDESLPSSCNPGRVGRSLSVDIYLRRI